MKKLNLLGILLMLLMLPANAESLYTFDMKNGLQPWASWMPVERTPDGVQMTLPGRLDPNHLDGIGPLWLLAHLAVASVGGPGYVDFDQAEISIRWRAHDVDLKGARILWWLTRQLPKEDTAPDFPWQETNWALTCCDLGSKLSDEWTTTNIKLDMDPARWSYAGTNEMQLGDWGERYVEYPLNKLLKDNAGSLHLAIVGTNASRPPTGKIEISEISIRTVKPAVRMSFNDIVPLLHQGKWSEVRWHLEKMLPSDDAAVNFHYGRLLALGIGGPQDYEKGAAHLQKAIDLPEARYELAKLYFYGLGVPRDQVKAVQLLETEGTSTNLDARALLGLAHAFGIGVAQDNDKAMSHFRYAAARGYAASMPELARRLMKSDPGEAYYWYRLARQRLTPDLVGAKTQMLDWNIQRLKEALPPSVLSAKDKLVEKFVPIK